MRSGYLFVCPRSVKIVVRDRSVIRPPFRLSCMPLIPRHKVASNRFDGTIRADEIELCFAGMILFFAVFVAFQSSVDVAFDKHIHLLCSKKSRQFVAVDPKTMSICLEAIIVLVARAIIPMLKDSHRSIRTPFSE